MNCVGFPATGWPNSEQISCSDGLITIECGSSFAGREGTGVRSYCGAKSIPPLLHVKDYLVLAGRLLQAGARRLYFTLARRSRNQAGEIRKSALTTDLGAMPSSATRRRRHVAATKASMLTRSLTLA